MEKITYSFEGKEYTVTKKDINDSMDIALGYVAENFRVESILKKNKATVSDLLSSDKEEDAFDAIIKFYKSIAVNNIDLNQVYKEYLASWQKTDSIHCLITNFRNCGFVGSQSFAESQSKPLDKQSIEANNLNSTPTLTYQFDEESYALSVVDITSAMDSAIQGMSKSRFLPDYTGKTNRLKRCKSEFDALLARNQATEAFDKLKEFIKLAQEKRFLIYPSKKDSNSIQAMLNSNKLNLNRLINDVGSCKFVAPKAAQDVSEADPSRQAPSQGNQQENQADIKKLVEDFKPNDDELARNHELTEHELAEQLHKASMQRARQGENLKPAGRGNSAASKINLAAISSVQFKVLSDSAALKAALDRILTEHGMRFSTTALRGTDKGYSYTVSADEGSKINFQPIVDAIRKLPYEFAYGVFSSAKYSELLSSVYKSKYDIHISFEEEFKDVMHLMEIVFIDNNIFYLKKNNKLIVPESDWNESVLKQLKKAGVPRGVMKFETYEKEKPYLINNKAVTLRDASLKLTNELLDERTVYTIQLNLPKNLQDPFVARYSKFFSEKKYCFLRKQKMEDQIQYELLIPLVEKETFKALLAELGNEFNHGEYFLDKSDQFKDVIPQNHRGIVTLDLLETDTKTKKNNMIELQRILCPTEQELNKMRTNIAALKESGNEDKTTLLLKLEETLANASLRKEKNTLIIDEYKTSKGIRKQQFSYYFDLQTLKGYQKKAVDLIARCDGSLEFFNGKAYASSENLRGANTSIHPIKSGHKSVVDSTGLISSALCNGSMSLTDSLDKLSKDESNPQTKTQGNTDTKSADHTDGESSDDEITHTP